MKILTKIALASSVGLSLLATPAVAQNASDECSASDDTTIVTAPRREQNLSEVPLAITVATNDQFSRDQI